MLAQNIELRAINYPNPISGTRPYLPKPYSFPWIQLSSLVPRNFCGDGGGGGGGGCLLYTSDAADE